MGTIHEIHLFNLFHRKEKKKKKMKVPIRGEKFYKNSQVGENTTLGANEFSRIYWRSTRGMVFDDDGRNEYVNAKGAQE